VVHSGASSLVHPRAGIPPTIGSIATPRLTTDRLPSLVAGSLTRFIIALLVSTNAEGSKPTSAQKSTTDPGWWEQWVVAKQVPAPETSTSPLTSRAPVRRTNGAVAATLRRPDGDETSDREPRSHQPAVHKSRLVS
jgi:hypothetical protein